MICVDSSVQQDSRRQASPGSHIMVQINRAISSGSQRDGLSSTGKPLEKGKWSSCAGVRGGKRTTNTRDVRQEETEKPMSVGPTLQYRQIS